MDNNINLVEIPYTDILTDEYMCNILNEYKWLKQELVN